MTESIYASTLPVQTSSLVKIFQSNNPPFLSNFYLSGGTALSLQLGHRESEDLDFFSTQGFEPLTLQNQLSQFGVLKETQLDTGTVNTYLSGVKLQFLHYPYRLLKPCVDWGQIRLSSQIDIACTKLQTISMRGSKKDFIDLFFLMKKFDLDELFLAIDEKYAGVNYNRMHILKSLVYFQDADDQPMPRMHRQVSWEEVKNSIVTGIKKLDFYTSHVQ